MFEKFADEARSVIVAAQREASSSGSEGIRTDHILLGLLSPGNEVFGVLTSLGISLSEVRERLSEAAAGRVAIAQAGLSAEAKDLIQAAGDEATQGGSKQIRSEHILLAALRREGDAIAAVLREFKDLDQIRHALLAAVGGRTSKPDESCSKCGAAIDEFGRVREMTMEIKDAREVRMYAYYCGRCGAAYGLVKGSE